VIESGARPGRKDPMRTMDLRAAAEDILKPLTLHAKTAF